MDSNENTCNMKYGPLPLGAVTVEDEACKNAFQREIKYLLSLDEERLLSGFYENAGLSAPRPRYGGWESELIGGHTLGHFLTAPRRTNAFPSRTR